MILILVQIGVLEYMSITTFLLISLKRKISLHEGLVLSEVFSCLGIYGLLRFLRRVVGFVLMIEFTGFLAPYLLWVDEFGTMGALFPALFHFVSAFNNAGFPIFTGNPTPFSKDIAILGVISLLSILGGLDFFVLNDLYPRLKRETNRL